MKTVDNFIEIIAGNDRYTSPENSVKIPFWGMNIDFYLTLAGVVFRANRMVKTGIYNDYNWVLSSLQLLHGWEKVGLKVEIEGMKNITKEQGPVIFIANHMSTYETVVLPGIIHPVKRVVFITKKELTKYPLFGPINSARDPIIVGRENPREDLKLVLEEGSARLKAGKSIMIFPQKTRSKIFDSKTFNTLGVKLAKQNNVPVVPVALLTDAYDNGKFVKELGRIYPDKTIHFEFGEPFKVEGRGADEQQRVMDFISSRLKKWGRSEYVKS